MTTGAEFSALLLKAFIGTVFAGALWIMKTLHTLTKDTEKKVNTCVQKYEELEKRIDALVPKVDVINEKINNININVAKIDADQSSQKETLIRIEKHLLDG